MSSSSLSLLPSASSSEDESSKLYTCGIAGLGLRRLRVHTGLAARPTGVGNDDGPAGWLAPDNPLLAAPPGRVVPLASALTCPAVAPAAADAAAGGSSPCDRSTTSGSAWASAASARRRRCGGLCAAAAAAAAPPPPPRPRPRREELCRRFRAGAGGGSGRRGDQLSCTAQSRVRPAR
jgi:hypothetical protein